MTDCGCWSCSADEPRPHPKPALLPAIRVEYLIQPRSHCGMRSYAVAGKNDKHLCGVCGERVPDSHEPWEIFTPDVTPRRDV